MMKLGAFPDGTQLNQSDVKRLSFPKLENGVWETPNRKPITEVEFVPKVFQFFLVMLRNQVDAEAEEAKIKSN